MSKSKNKKQKKDQSDDDAEDEDMYMQLTEIKQEKSLRKKDKKNKNGPKKSNSSSSNHEGEDEEEDLVEIDIFKGKKESISNLQEIKDINGFIVKQVFSPCETLTGCQTQNAYEVFPATSSDQEINEQSIPVLKSLELSNCCVRNMLSGRCRPFEMTITTHVSSGESQFYEQVVLVLKREFKCTFFCWQRPIIEVFQVKKGVHELVGRVLNPFNFCDLNMLISDRFDNQLFTIAASCCQCGFICQNAFGCKYCQEMEFKVLDQNGDEYTKISKKQISCLVNCVSDTSKYYINFPQDTENPEKLLLLAATILIDYTYFEGGSKICLNF